MVLREEAAMAVVARGGGCIRDELGEYVSPGADGGGGGFWIGK